MRAEEHAMVSFQTQPDRVGEYFGVVFVVRKPRLMQDSLKGYLKTSSGGL